MVCIRMSVMIYFALFLPPRADGWFDLNKLVVILNWKVTHDYNLQGTRDKSNTLHTWFTQNNHTPECPAWRVCSNAYYATREPMCKRNNEYPCTVHFMLLNSIIGRALATAYNIANTAICKRWFTVGVTVDAVVNLVSTQRQVFLICYTMLDESMKRF